VHRAGREVAAWLVRRVRHGAIGSDGAATLPITDKRFISADSTRVLMTLNEKGRATCLTLRRRQAAVDRIEPYCLRRSLKCGSRSGRQPFAVDASSAFKVRAYGKGPLESSTFQGRVTHLMVRALRGVPRGTVAQCLNAVEVFP
jgi:hypothetical protein